MNRIAEEKEEDPTLKTTGEENEFVHV